METHLWVLVISRRVFPEGCNWRRKTHPKNGNVSLGVPIRVFPPKALMEEERPPWNNSMIIFIYSLVSGWVDGVGSLMQWQAHEGQRSTSRVISLFPYVGPKDRPQLLVLMASTFPLGDWKPFQNLFSLTVIQEKSLLRIKRKKEKLPWTIMKTVTEKKKQLMGEFFKIKIVEFSGKPGLYLGKKTKYFRTNIPLGRKARWNHRPLWATWHAAGIGTGSSGRTSVLNC